MRWINNLKMRTRFSLYVIMVIAMIISVNVICYICFQNLKEAINNISNNNIYTLYVKELQINLSPI